MFRVWLSGLLVVSVSVLAGAADWPGYLGPNSNAVSPETGLLDKWPDSGPPVLWTVDVGAGYGGAAIADGQVHLLDRVDANTDILRVLDLETGKEIWRYEYKAEGKLSHSGSRSTPAVTSTHIFTVGGWGHVHAFDRKSRKVVWTYQLDNPKGINKWGVAQSPLVHNGKVILPRNGAETPGLVALDAQTGKEVWTSKSFGGDNYATPIVRTIDGKKGILLVANTRVVFVDPTNGETIWEYTDYHCKYNIPGPTVLSDGHHVFVTGAYDSDSKMLEVKDGKITEKFTLSKTGAHIHTPIEHDGYLYVNFSQNSNARTGNKTAGLGCLDPKTGKILWRTGIEGKKRQKKRYIGRGGYLLADGKLILLDGGNGNLYLIEPDPSGYREISRVDLFKGGEEIWAPMALSNGRLVLRDRSKLKCLDLRAK